MSLDEIDRGARPVIRNKLVDEATRLRDAKRGGMDDERVVSAMADTVVAIAAALELLLLDAERELWRREAEGR